MANYHIPKEIQTEDKTFIYLSLKQAIYVFAAFVFLAIIFITLKPNADTMIPISMATGLLVMALSSAKNENLSFEGLVFKYTQKLVYNSTKRKYRTRNRYISVYNSYYRNIENREAQDKRIMKAKKKQNKRLQKEMKKSKIKPIL